MNASVAEIGSLLDALEIRRAPVDEQETASLERFRLELDRLTDPCSEIADTTHVTSSVIIVGPRGIVLHKHKRLGIWLQPGGHIDPNESPDDAALREAAEETGLSCRHFAGTPLLVHVDAHDGPRGHHHLDLRYLLTAPDVDPTPPQGESQDVRWWTFGEILDGADIAGLSGLVRALRRFELRPVTAADGNAIYEIMHRSFRWAYRDGLVRSPHTDEEDWQFVHEILLAQQSVTVATAAGIVIGYMATTPGWVGHLYIDPAWVGYGVGTRLLNSAKSALADGFDLWTFVENVRARTFYERHGLVVVEFTDGSGNEERQPDIRYRWAPRS